MRDGHQSPLHQNVCSKKTLGFYVPEGCLGAVLLPLDKELTGHLTVSLTGALTHTN